MLMNFNLFLIVNFVLHLKITYSSMYSFKIEKLIFHPINWTAFIYKYCISIMFTYIYTYVISLLEEWTTKLTPMYGGSNSGGTYVSKNASNTSMYGHNIIWSPFSFFTVFHFVHSLLFFGKCHWGYFSLSNISSLFFMSH